jgi:ABC-type transport system involved in multi-copper enzyme maturation permease subunit
MTGLTTILRKELKNFTGSGPGVFIMYAVISVLWSFMLVPGTFSAAGFLWLTFFSVIITANFSATVFISDRVNGTLEVLITSGVSRDAVLFGKMLFVVAMATAIGLACVLLSLLWAVLLPEMHGTGAGSTPALGAFGLYAFYAALYLSATLFNAAASAYLSVRMSNPRFLHFIILFMTGTLVTACTALNMQQMALVLTFFLAGMIFTYLARREFAGERIIRPIIF